MSRNLLISEQEKKQIFDRLLEIESKVDTFIDEAQSKINDTVHQINGLNGRLSKLETEVFHNGKR